MKKAQPDPERLMPKPRLAVIQAWFAPYRVPLFRALHASGRVDLTVLYCAPVEKGRGWPVPSQLPYPAEFLRPRPLLHYRHRRLFDEQGTISYPRHLVSTLARLRPTVVVGYEFRLDSLLAAIFSITRGCAYVTWSDVTAAHDARMGRPRIWMRRLLLTRSAALIGSSTATLDHFKRNFGVPADRSFLSILSAHAEEFRQLAAGSGGEENPRGQAFRLLYVGRLISLKGVDLLIEAFARLLRKCPHAELTIIGHGPQKKELQRHSRRSGCGNRVAFVDAMPHEQLAAEMGRHDVFVFPSRLDVFGLVVAEAVACGLPVICSCHAGAAADLVDGNGIVVDPTDVAALTEALRRLAADEGLRRRMASRAAAVLTKHSLDSAVEGFLGAVRRASFMPAKAAALRAAGKPLKRRRVD